MKLEGETMKLYYKSPVCGALCAALVSVAFCAAAVGGEDVRVASDTPAEKLTVEEIVAEMLESRTSERSTRVIDHDGDSSMEQKKREGYF